jgi:hypothetical protein
MLTSILGARLSWHFANGWVFEPAIVGPDIVDYTLKEGPHAGRHAIQHFYFRGALQERRRELSPGADQRNELLLSGTQPGASPTQREAGARATLSGARRRMAAIANGN